MSSSPPDNAHRFDPAGLVAEVVAGPDCRPPQVLPEGRFVLGRDPTCDICLDDDTVAPFHAVVDLRAESERPGADATWSVDVVPLVGAHTTRLDGDPRGASASERRSGLDGDSRLTIGSSVVEFRPGSDRSRAHGDEPAVSRLVRERGGQVVVHRRFAVARRPDPRSVRVPDEPTLVPSPPATGLVAALVGAAGALLVSTVIGGGVMAVFAVVAACASLVMWVGAWVKVARARGRARRDREIAVAGFASELRAATVDAEQAERRRTPGISVVLRNRCRVAERSAPGLWVDRVERVERSGEWVAARPLDVVVGWGRRRWSGPSTSPPGPRTGQGIAEAAARFGLRMELSDVPISVGLVGRRAVAVTGRRRRSVARSMIAQLAWSTGPADVRLVIVTDDPDRWQWIRGLPHLRDDRSIVDVSEPSSDVGHTQRLEDALSTGASPNEPVHLVVVDRVGDRAEVDAAIRARLDRPGVMALVLVDDPPSWVDEVVDIGRTGTVAHRRLGGSDVIAALAVGISEETASSIASSLSQLIDPESTVSSAIPDRCGFVDAQPACGGSAGGLTDETVAAWWRAAGDDPRPIAWLGIDRSGPVSIDLVSDGPHVLLAGTTGSGKSEFLRTLVLGLAVRCSPAHLGFVLVDYKGGAAFDACSALPHVLGSVTDLDDGLAARALCGLEAELRRRSERFRAVGASDLHEFRIRGDATDEPMPRIVVVVDEFATLAKERPDFLTALVDVAQRGRSLGVHLVLATQRPAGVVSEDIRANTALRLALRTEDEADSRDVIGSGAAAALPRRTPGRVLLRGDDGSLAELQVASTAVRVPDDPARTELEQVVATIVDANARNVAPRVGALWLPPLPALIEPDRLFAEVTVGADAIVASGPVPSGSARPIGVVDDPARQCRRPLTWSAGDGSLLVVGSVGAGCTSTLIALGAAACARAAPDDLHLGVIDALGDRRLDVFEPLAHSLGTVQSHDGERFRRLLDRLAEGSRGREAGGRRVPTVLLIDGLDALWQQLLVPDPGTDAGLAVTLRHLVLHGADLDIDVVATSRGGALPTGFAARDTWVGALDDPAVARAAGWRGEPPGRSGPGRFGVVSTGLVAQVALGAPGLADLPPRSGMAGGPDPVRCLPERVDASELAGVDRTGSGGSESGATVLPIGLDATDLMPAGPRLDAGRHLLVVGRPGSGVSSTLSAIGRAWSAHHRSGIVIEVVDDATLDEGVRTWEAGPPTVELLVLVDDAHRIADRDGRLLRLVEQRPAGPVDGGGPATATVVAGVRLESFRAAYGHWTRAIASAEHGIALATSGEPPTEVFGVSAPRRPVVAARPGLGWLVDGGRVRAIQIVTEDTVAEPR